MDDSKALPRRMSNKLDRYLVSSVLLDPSFRHKIWALVDSEDPCALAPEPGLDLHRLVYICQLLRSREIRYRRIFASVTIIALILVFFAPDTADLLVLILGAFIVGVVYAYKTNELNERLISPMISQNSNNPDTITAELARRYTGQNVRRPLPIHANEQNVVIYSGFSPFVGAGVELNGWSFPVNVSRPLEELDHEIEIKPFQPADLYRFVEERIARCAFQGYRSQDYLFVNGKQVRNLDWLLPEITDRPLCHVPPEIIQHYMDKSDPVVRHYKWMQVSGWEDELVLSYFLRFSMQGDHLFTEVNRYLLPPIHERYCNIDKLDEKDDEPKGFQEALGEKLSALFTSVIAAPFVAIWHTLATVGDALTALARWDPFGWGRQRRAAQIRRNHQYDYGARNSIRSEIGGASYGHYFQKLDQEMYVKIFEKQILESLIEFLNAHNIDTSDIQERQKAILNTGLIVQGGALQAESLAVGSGARSSFRQQVSQHLKGMTGDTK